MALLEVRNVTRRFGGIVALDDVSFEAPEGEIVGLIGPNGAGKTTVFNVITRLYRPEEGEVFFDGRDVLERQPHQVVRLGIARTFQNLALFPSLSVLDNLLVGAHTRVRGREAAERRRAKTLLDYGDLGDIAEREAGSLSYATQKRVEVARALMTEPRLLLLDEPAGGLSREEVDALEGFIVNARRDFTLTVLLVEHHMRLVMGVSERVHVLDFGRLIASGSAAEVQADPAVIEAYLGAPEEALETETE